MLKRQKGRGSLEGDIDHHTRCLAEAERDIVIATQRRDEHAAALELALKKKMIFDRAQKEIKELTW